MWNKIHFTSYKLRDLDSPHYVLVCYELYTDPSIIMDNFQHLQCAAFVSLFFYIAPRVAFLRPMNVLDATAILPLPS